MSNYIVPANPANDTWTRAYRAESTNLFNSIDAINGLGYLQMRSYASNTISTHLSTTLDSETNPTYLLKILDDLACVAADNYAQLQACCFSERYAVVQMVFGTVHVSTESQPVYKIDLGNIYFRGLTNDEYDDATLDDAKTLVNRLWTIARDDSDREHLTTFANTFANK